MPTPRRLVLCGYGAALCELALGAALAVAVGAQRVSLVLAVSAALTAALAAAIGPLLRPRGDSRVRAGVGEPDPEPPWWPQFEHDLRAHLRERERSPV